MKFTDALHTQRDEERTSLQVGGGTTPRLLRGGRGEGDVRGEVKDAEEKSAGLQGNRGEDKIRTRGRGVRLHG